MYSAKETAEMTGLSTVALRYYEKEQLLPQIARTSQKYRQYSDSDIEWIKMVQCLRMANVPIQSVPEKVVKIAYHKMMKGKRLVIPGVYNKLLVAFSRVMPISLTNRITILMMK